MQTSDFYSDVFIHPESKKQTNKQTNKPSLINNIKSKQAIPLRRF